jgi:FtsH-binding integral membrane protein
MNTELNARKVFQNTHRIYGILFLTMIVFLVAASLIVSNMGPLLQEDPSMFHILKYIAIGVPIVAIPIAYSYPQKLISRISPELGFPEKLMEYEGALFIRFALVEGAAILVSIFFMLTGDTNLMMVLAIILLFFILSRPTPFKAATDLGLTEDEKAELMK